MTTRLGCWWNSFSEPRQPMPYVLRS